MPCSSNVVGMHISSTSTYMIFEPILFFDHHGPKGKFGRFEGKQKQAISPKPEQPRPPKLVSMHFMSTSICMNFLRRFYFLTPMDYSPWSEREIWPFLKVAVSPKPKRSHPPKLVHMHNSSILICIYFLVRFQSIKFFDDRGL